jgi:hypothetical protein
LRTKQQHRTPNQPDEEPFQCSGEFMKVSNSLIATAVATLLPLAAIAGDKAKTPAPMGTETRAQFDTLDANRDGRLSPAEAATDTKLVFSSADKNGDGYLDASEYGHRDMMGPSQGESTSPDREAPKPQQ